MALTPNYIVVKIMTSSKEKTNAQAVKKIEEVRESSSAQHLTDASVVMSTPNIPEVALEAPTPSDHLAYMEKLGENIASTPLENLIKTNKEVVVESQKRQLKKLLLERIPQILTHPRLIITTELRHELCNIFSELTLSDVAHMITSLGHSAEEATRHLSREEILAMFEVQRIRDLPMAKRYRRRPRLSKIQQGLLRKKPSV